jgi:hypothetical protein
MPSESMSKLAHIASVERSLVAKTKGMSIESVEPTMKASSSSLATMMIEAIEEKRASGAEDLESSVSMLADILPNCFREIRSNTETVAATSADLQVEMDDGAIDVVLRAHRLGLANEKLSTAVAETLEQLAVLAYSKLRKQFLEDGALEVLFSYAGSELPALQQSAAAGIANLVVLRDAADDWSFKQVLLERGILGCIHKLAQSPSIMERTQELADPPVKSEKPKTKVENAEKMAFGGMSSLPLRGSTSNRETVKAGPGGIQNQTSDGLCRTLLNMSSAAGANDALRIISHHFIQDGGLNALCLLALRYKWSPDGPSHPAAVQSMLAYAIFNLAHLASMKPALLQAVVSWLNSNEPRVFTPSIGVLCTLCRFQEARADLVAAGAGKALEGFARRQIQRQQKGVDQRIVQRAAVCGKLLSTAQ